jgi:hypothetical protein
MRPAVRARRHQFVVEEGGKNVAIIPPVAKYKKLLEELHGLAVVAERWQEEPVDLQEMKRRLKAHGLLKQFNQPG